LDKYDAKVAEEHMNSKHHEQAQRFRELDGTAKLEQTLDRAVCALYGAEIPHLVTGGYALQEYGCRRHTDNVDLIVPDVTRAFEVLTRNGFEPCTSTRTIVVDPDTTFEVRLHAGAAADEMD
jgi:hypothetical protein